MCLFVYIATYMYRYIEIRKAYIYTHMYIDTGIHVVHVYTHICRYGSCIICLSSFAM